MTKGLEDSEVGSGHHMLNGIGIEYDFLKSILKNVAATRSEPNTVVTLERVLNVESNLDGSKLADFNTALERELDKVETFIRTKRYQVINVCLNLFNEATNIVKLLSAEAPAAAAPGRLDQTAGLEPRALRDNLADLSKRTDQICNELIALDAFRRNNAALVSRILEQAAGEYGGAQKPIILRRLSRPIWTKGIETVVLPVISDIYAIIREKKHLSNAVDHKTAATIERRTTKYLCEVQDVARLKLLFAKYYPLHSFGVSSGRRLLEVQAQLQEEEHQDCAGWITSVYFDSDQFDLYHRRLEREEGAILLRLRWYDLEPHANIFIERKTHHDCWVERPSVKERFEVKASKVEGFLDGSWSIDKSIDRNMAAHSLTPAAADTTKALAAEVRAAYQSQGLQPKLRTVYRRCAFQVAADTGVRLTVDTELHYGAEDREACSSGALWRGLSDRLDASQVAAFPYAIVEVKLNAAEPEFLSRVIKSGILVEVPKFSKFLTGCACLYRDRIPALPHWFEDAKLRTILASPSPALGLNSFSKPGAPAVDPGQALGTPHSPLAPQLSLTSLPSQAHSPALLAHSASLPKASVSKSYSLDPSPDAAEVESIEIEHKQAMQSHQARRPHWWTKLFASHDPTPLPGGASANERKRISQLIAQRAMVKVEPKTYFANERTFIQWLSAAMLLVSLSVVLLNLDSARARRCAYIIMPVATVFAGYALAMYLWRVQRLQTKYSDGAMQQYADRVGPVFMTVFLIAAMAVVSYFVADDVKREERAAADLVAAVSPPANVSDTLALYTIDVPNSTALLDLPMGGYSILDFQPSGVAYLPAAAGMHEEMLLIPSLFSLFSAPAAGGQVELQAPIANDDLEEILVVEGSPGNPPRVFLLSEYTYGKDKVKGAILEYSMGAQQVLARWDISDFGLTGMEGLAFVPDDRFINGGLFFVGDSDGRVVGFELYYGQARAMRALNHAVMNAGLGNPKIGAMDYSDGLLWILHDNSRVIRAWNITAGVLVAEYRVPWMTRQCEGFEVIAGGADSSGEISAYLVFDTPPSLHTLHLPVFAMSDK